MDSVADKELKDKLTLQDRGLSLLFKKIDQLQTVIAHKSRSPEIADAIEQLIITDKEIQKNQPVLQTAAKAVMRRLMIGESIH